MVGLNYAVISQIAVKVSLKFDEVQLITDDANTEDFDALVDFVQKRKPHFERAKTVAETLGVKVYIVWPIIKNIKSEDINHLIAEVKRALRI